MPDAAIMMNRRRFFVALAALPFVGRLLEPRHQNTLVDDAFPLRGDPRFYGGMKVMVSSPDGHFEMEVSRDGQRWRRYDVWNGERWASSDWRRIA